MDFILIALAICFFGTTNLIYTIMVSRKVDKLLKEWGIEDGKKTS